MPDSTTETMWGIIDEMINNGDSVVAKILDERFAGYEKQFATAVGVKRGDNPELAEQMEKDLQKGMRVGVRFDVSEYYNSNYKKNVKSRTLIEILGRGDNNQKPASQPFDSSSEFIPSPAQVYQSAGQQRGNAFSNATNLINTHLTMFKTLPDNEFIDQALAKIFYTVDKMTAGREEKIEEEEVITEGNPF